jgi:hypothetical protein
MTVWGEPLLRAHARTCRCCTQKDMSIIRISNGKKWRRYFNGQLHALIACVMDMIWSIWWIFRAMVTSYLLGLIHINLSTITTSGIWASSCAHKSLNTSCYIHQRELFSRIPETMPKSPPLHWRFVESRKYTYGGMSRVFRDFSRISAKYDDVIMNYFESGISLTMNAATVFRAAREFCSL